MKNYGYASVCTDSHACAFMHVYLSSWHLHVTVQGDLTFDRAKYKKANLSPLIKLVL